ncbi:unnamed protein product, partial [Choristocarpus tenellus]
MASRLVPLARRGVLQYHSRNPRLIRYVVRPLSSVQKQSDNAKEPEVTNIDRAALAPPIDFDMCSVVEGQESQIVTIELEPNQMIRAEAGNLVFMEDGIEMDTSTGGGMSSMFKRVITGQNMFVTDYVNKGLVNKRVALGTDVPSKIIRLPLSDYGGAVVCQRGAFLAGSHSIEIE